MRAGWAEYVALSPQAGPAEVEPAIQHPTRTLQQSLKYRAGGLSLGRRDQVGHDKVDNTARALSIEADMESLRLQADVAAKLSTGYAAQAAWDNANRQFLSKRADLEKELLEMKLAMAQVDWFLKAQNQFEALKPRYHQALRDAEARLSAVSTGLNQLYGYVDPMPQLSESEASVDQIVAWTRRAITWLGAFNRKTQALILPISLKAATKERWSAGRDVGAWTFALDETHLGLSRARVRRTGSLRCRR